MMRRFDLQNRTGPIQPRSCVVAPGYGGINCGRICYAPRCGRAAARSSAELCAADPGQVSRHQIEERFVGLRTP